MLLWAVLLRRWFYDPWSGSALALSVCQRRGQHQIWCVFMRHHKFNAALCMRRYLSITSMFARIVCTIPTQDCPHRTSRRTMHIEASAIVQSPTLSSQLCHRHGHLPLPEFPLIKFRDNYVLANAVLSLSQTAAPKSSCFSEEAPNEKQKAHRYSSVSLANLGDVHPNAR